MTFHEKLGILQIPTDELIFFRGVGIPPTSFGTTFTTRDAQAVLENRVIPENSENAA
jgi:hypothetical protein